MDRPTQLLAFARQRDLTETERQELVTGLRALGRPAGEKLLSSSMSNIEVVEDMSPALADAMLDNIFSEASSSTAAIQTKTVHRVHFIKNNWFRYAAAIIVIVTGIALYYNFLHTAQPGNEVARTTPPSVSNDVMPGSDRAVLTLSNGRKVELDSAASETIKDGTLSIENYNGQLVYKKGDMVAMNTMTTPKGGQYQLTLSDGTKVWLNAASSITYPTAFQGKSRAVTITGEAYFEVAKNKSKPFLVSFDNSKVEVLGTSFNINAYADEATSSTTLIEGSVRIRSADQQLVLKPGQQAVKENGIKLNTAPNIRQVLAWKNGAFDFNNLDFETCMRQLERWYDIKVVYDRAVPKDKFLGQIDKNLTLREVLEGLSGVVAKFRLEDRTLHVLP
jgi:transmembrane sensor